MLAQVHFPPHIHGGPQVQALWVEPRNTQNAQVLWVQADCEPHIEKSLSKEMYFFTMFKINNSHLIKSYTFSISK